MQEGKNYSTASGQREGGEESQVNEPSMFYRMTRHRRRWVSSGKIKRAERNDSVLFTL